jgi:hypothetical protein
MGKAIFIAYFLSFVLYLGPFGTSFPTCLFEKGSAWGSDRTEATRTTDQGPLLPVKWVRPADSEEYERLMDEVRRLLEEIKRLKREARDKFNEEVLPLIRRKLEKLRELLEEFNSEEGRSKEDDVILT